MQTEALANKRLQFHDMDVQANQHIFARDVAHGLAAPQKWLPPKYFYDERGSRLYEQICALARVLSLPGRTGDSQHLCRCRFMPRSATWRWWSSAPGVPPRPVTCSQRMNGPGDRFAIVQ